MEVCRLTCCLPALAMMTAVLWHAQPSFAADGQVIGARGMVATVNPLATKAGLQALRAGGNAVDAAVAAALTLGVVDGHNSGLGGGCLILVRCADGRQLAIDGRETAPATAVAEMYVRQGQVELELSQTGALASGVPGALAAYQAVLEQAGRLPLAALLRPAADLAEQGFAIDEVLAERLRASAPQLQRFDSSRAIFLKADGAPYRAGEQLVQADLARSYRAIADQGTEWFYRGSFAQATHDWMAQHGGLLTVDDFRAYQSKARTPIVTTYRGYTVIGFPPPSSGGIHVAQVLNILECFDLATIYQRDEAMLMHVVAEAMKLAMADRAHWLGDADFVSVPRGLIDKPYARELSRRIDLQRAATVAGHGTPADAQTDVFGGHTTHIATADAEGNWVALTATVNTSFGSKVVIPGTGIVLNNQMDDFSTQPGVPNAYGLVGAQNNAIAPGKRPLSSMSPTIVLKDGQPVLTLGGAGGPKIITQAVLTLIRWVDLQWPLERCLSEPRWHHQWRPDKLLVEATVPELLRQRLRERGHTVEAMEASGIVQAIAGTHDGRLVGVHDPRVPGLAAGW